MVARINKLHLIAADEVVAAPRLRACEDRNFGLPTPILLGVFGLFMAYLAVMSIGFMADMLVLPMVVNVIFVAAFAYVPAKWALMKPAKSDRALRWSELRESGIDTLTGRTSGTGAAVLVLLLPFLILCWGIAVVTIAALV
jgi:hypothetical protein